MQLNVTVGEIPTSSSSSSSAASSIKAFLLFFALGATTSSSSSRSSSNPSSPSSLSLRCLLAFVSFFSVLAISDREDSSRCLLFLSPAGAQWGPLSLSCEIVKGIKLLAASSLGMRVREISQPCLPNRAACGACGPVLITRVLTRDRSHYRLSWQMQTITKHLKARQGVRQEIHCKRSTLVDAVHLSFITIYIFLVDQRLTPWDA